MPNAGDLIDLGVLFGADASLSYAEDASSTGGVLTVTSSAGTISVTLNGDFEAAGFTLAADDDGSALLSYDVNAYRLIDSPEGDYFVFDALPDAPIVISDFEAGGVDKIQLSGAIFDGIGLDGSFDYSSFTNISGAEDTATDDARILFDESTGNLYYDVDGGDAGSRMMLATLSLTEGSRLDASDFLLSP